MTKTPEEGVTTERADDTPRPVGEEPSSLKTAELLSDTSSTSSSSSSSSSSEDTKTEETAHPEDTPAPVQEPVTTKGEEIQLSEAEVKEKGEEKEGEVAAKEKEEVVVKESEEKEKVEVVKEKEKEEEAIQDKEEGKEEVVKGKEGEREEIVKEKKEEGESVKEEKEEVEEKATEEIEKEGEAESVKEEVGEKAAEGIAKEEETESVKEEKEAEEKAAEEIVEVAKEKEERGKEEEKEKEEKDENSEEAEEGSKGDNSESSGRDVIAMDGRADTPEGNLKIDAEPKENEVSSPSDSTSESKAPAAEVNGHDDQSPPSSDTLPKPAVAEEEPGAAEDNNSVRGGSQEEAGDPAAPVVENNDGGHYEDDFSEISEISDKGAGAKAAPAPPAADGSGSTAGEVKPEDRKSPPPSSRAEAGAVVPVPPSKRMSDGRSFAEERGEGRGEDRSEAPCEEGSDSRGQGQWKSEEELFLQSSLANQKAEKETLQGVIDEKVKIQKELDDLKSRFLSLEENSKRWELDTSSLRQECQDQTVRIKELEEEQGKLREFEQWGKDNEGKVRDLQARLAARAGEDAEKDRRIQKLQEELQDTRTRLVSTERQLAVSNEAVQQQRPAQQSKTCTIL